MFPFFCRGLVIVLFAAGAAWGSEVEDAKRGTEPAIEVIPLVLDFGVLAPGRTLALETTVRNAGKGSLLLAELAIEEALSDPFHLVDDGCSNRVLEQDDTCRVRVAFSPPPAASGAFTGGFDFLSNDRDDPEVHIGLRGTAEAGIRVTDSAAPMDDHRLDFGTLAPGGSRDLSITVANAGGADLEIAAVAPSLWGNFSLVSDECSEEILATGQTCMITVRFNPAVAGIFTGTLEIVPTGAGNAAVRMELAGVAEAAPPPSPSGTSAIQISGGAGPVPLEDPMVLDFGSVYLAGKRELSVMIGNGGQADLVLGNFDLAGALQLPFGAVSDGCSGKTLGPNTTCSARMRFSPTEFGIFTDAFEIPSNDPDHRVVRFEVRGAAGADIEVTDAVEPKDDLAIPFGDVPLGMSKRKTILVGNNGTGDLQLGVIPSGPINEQFTIVGVEENRQHCSERLLRPGQTCPILVHFRPTGEQAFSGQVAIPSDDPNENTVLVTLSGAGVPASADFPAPLLIHPEPGQINLRPDVSFRWYNCRDKSGKIATYRLYCSTSEDWSNLRIRRVGERVLGLAGFGLGGVLLLTPRQRRRVRIAASILIVLCLGTLVMSCSDSVEDSATGTLGDLEAKTTFRWKVVAEYDDGLEKESQVQTFTTR